MGILEGQWETGKQIPLLPSNTYMLTLIILSDSLLFQVRKINKINNPINKQETQ